MVILVEQRGETGITPIASKSNHFSQLCIRCVFVFFKAFEALKFIVTQLINIRAEIHRKKREERRQRYLAADLHKQRYSKWKETISTIIGPDAARAGRMFIKRRAYLLNKKKKKEREDLILKKKQLWAKSVIHDANRCVKGYGFIPWKTYIHEQHQRLHRVEKMKWKSIVSKCYVQWKRNVHDMKR